MVWKRVSLRNTKYPINEYGGNSDSATQVLLAGVEVEESCGKAEALIYRDSREVKKYSGEEIPEDMVF